MWDLSADRVRARDDRWVLSHSNSPAWGGNSLAMAALHQDSRLLFIKIQTHPLEEETALPWLLFIRSKLPDESPSWLACWYIPNYLADVITICSSSCSNFPLNLHVSSSWLTGITNGCTWIHTIFKTPFLQKYSVSENQGHILHL